MIRFVSAISVISLLLSAAVSAQMKHPAAMAPAKDTSVQNMGSPRERSERQGIQENEPWREMKESPYLERERMEHGGLDNWGMWRHEPMKMRMMFHPFKYPVLFPALFLFLCIVIMAGMNILLTILVTLDMARRNQFNGLWIPILLFVGIPGTMLYALFRIGDNLNKSQEK